MGVKEVKMEPHRDHALLELTPEQVRIMSRVEKDQWWFTNVFRGNVPQLTWRSAITGMVLGGALSLTNIYIGYKTGWTLGVGITSVIISFAVFALMARIGLTAPMTILENNAMQSIATSAGYVLAPLFSSLGAYMMITGTVIPQHQAIIWMILVSLLGVLLAFPLKRRFINDEQHPFPEGKAAGIVMHSLHTLGGKLEVRVLTVAMGITAFLSFLKEGAILTKLADRLGGWVNRLAIPEFIDAPVYALMKWTPAIRGISFEKLTIGIESDFPLIAAGGLMGMRTGAWLLIGGVVNYFVLAPWLITHGIIPDEGGFKNITKWSLWFGVALMTSSSLTAFFGKPGMIAGAFRGWRKRSTQPTEVDILKDVELPLWVSYLGVPIIGTIVAIVTHLFFKVPLWTGFAAIPIVFLVTIIAVHSTALTSITPGGALGKLTQLSFSFMAPGKALTNLMAAGIAGEAMTNTANLLMDIKPGYMLGAKPRQQAVGHVLGIFAGALVAVPVWYAMFGGDVSQLGSKEFPMPGATTWKAVAEVLAQGFTTVHPTARWAMLLGLLLGIGLEFASKASQGKLPISAMGLGLAFVMPFTNSMSMFLGCFVFFCLGKIGTKGGTVDRVIVGNQETICAGGIAGGSITSIVFRLIA